MINLDFTGMCKGCEYASLELDCLESTYWMKSRKEWTVRCIHADACGAMEDKMIEKYKMGGDTE